MKLEGSPGMRKSQRTRRHQHGEAFRLMRYECKDCGHSEVLWNSRDGVTPFGIRCDGCGEANMLHTCWSQDVYAPEHIPERGQGVFITMPSELRMVFARQRVRHFDGTEHELRGQEREEMVVAVAADFDDGEPMLIRWR